MVCPKESSGKKQIINIFKRKVIVMVVLRLQATFWRLAKKRISKH
jgi:hypothetical protein